MKVDSDLAMLVAFIAVGLMPLLSDLHRHRPLGVASALGSLVIVLSVWGAVRRVASKRGK